MQGNSFGDGSAPAHAGDDLSAADSGLAAAHHRRAYLIFTTIFLLRLAHGFATSRCEAKRCLPADLYASSSWLLVP